jgi:anti-sigma factor RsiW
MNMNVTHQVISDLWPLHVSGEASADTRALVEAFLASDPVFAKTLHDSADVVLGVGSAPTLSPDHELQALARTRRRLKGYAWLLRLAGLFSALAFGRIVSDTSWDVSPRHFIITASIAAVFWIAFCVSLIRNRARIMIVSPDRRSP